MINVLLSACRDGKQALLGIPCLFNCCREKNTPDKIHFLESRSGMSLGLGSKARETFSLFRLVVNEPKVGLDEPNFLTGSNLIDVVLSVESSIQAQRVLLQSST